MKFLKPLDFAQKLLEEDPMVLYTKLKKIDLPKGF